MGAVPVGDVELPGDAEPILNPGEAAAEPIVVRGHENDPITSQLVVDCRVLSFRIDVKEQRDGWREREVVHGWAVIATDEQAADLNLSHRNGPLGSRSVCPVA